jgi:hypothetical protein
MSPFESYELIIPELWSKADEWQEALKESEGADSTMRAHPIASSEL